jgi:hypothetical protein
MNVQRVTQLLHDSFVSGLQKQLVSVIILNYFECQNILRSWDLDVPRVNGGTRLAVKMLMPHVVEAVLTGCVKVEDIEILKITVVSTDVSFQFGKLQFPLCPAVAASINKLYIRLINATAVDVQTVFHMDNCPKHVPRLEV